MTPPDIGRILDTVSSVKSGLNPVGIRIADYILKNAEDISRHSISGLALNAGVGEASVVRFCKTLGYAGFHDFKIALAIEASATAGKDKSLLDTDIQDEDSSARLGQKLQAAVQKALSETLNLIDYSLLERCAAALREARSVFTIGVGTSANTALYAKHKLTRIGLSIDSGTDIHFAYMKIALLTSQDVVIGVSYGGESLETVNALRLAREAGARTVAITHNLNSTVAGYADFALFSGNRQGELQGDSVATMTAQLIVVEMLYTLLILDDFEKARSLKSITARAVDHKRGGKS